MKLKLSKSMIKCIDEVKEESLELVKYIPIMECLKIQRKATKKKIFDFHIMNLGRPGIKVYINDRFFKSYLFSKGKWTED